MDVKCCRTGNCTLLNTPKGVVVSFENSGTMYLPGLNVAENGEWIPTPDKADEKPVPAAVQEFKVGAVVTLKSGGQRMTISGRDIHPDMRWIVRHSLSDTYSMPEKCLVVVDP